MNPEQQLLSEKIVSQDFNKLLILGEAGTGKTYTLCKSLSEVVRGGYNNLVLCAPTHLAKLNILEKIDEDVRHLVETSTVASLLLKFGIDKEDGSTQFTSGKVDKVNKYGMIVLDECSMISEQDYMLLMTSKAKVIFTGDFKQLPPVMAKSAETKMGTHQGTGNLEVFHLTRQMRQQGVIHKAAEKNRTRAWFPTRSEVGSAGESITVHPDRSSLVESMIGALLKDSRGYEATHHHRYIAYKNETVRQIGKTVRDRVLDNYFGFNAESVPFICHELLMMRENKPSIGYNGELVEVLSVTREPSQHPWRSYSMRVKGSLGSGLIRTIPPCDQPLLAEYIAGLQTRLRQFQIAGDAESAAKVLKQIKKTKAHWTTTQYPYAVTTHKSQGSTLECVYLDTLSFVRAPNKRALLYVGISRASRQLHTVAVPENQVRTGSEINADYRQARAAYEAATGKSYRGIIRSIGFMTGSPEGKALAAGYLWAVVEDLKQ